jgi:5'-3' exoribonuclease 1
VLSSQFVYDEGAEENYPSSHPGFFPDIMKCRCKCSPFTLPTLGDGVELILGLLDGVHLGASALAGFPSLETLPHTGALGYHGVSVFQSDSRNQSMVVTVGGKHDKSKAEEIAKIMIGQRTFHSWPYLQEGLVSAVSDDMFRYELHQMGRGSKVVSTPHNPYQAISWKKQADYVEHHNSKRYGIIIGNVDLILHVRPLKGEWIGGHRIFTDKIVGLKRLDTGALVKDYEEADKEIAQAWQLAVTQVTYEDERFMVSCRLQCMLYLTVV